MTTTLPLLLLLLSVLTARVSYSEKVSYAGYSVLEIVPASDKEMLAVREILGVVPCRQLSEQMGTTRPAHLLCDRSQSRTVKQMARKSGLEIKTKSKSLEREIKREMMPPKKKTKKSKRNKKKKRRRKASGGRKVTMARRRKKRNKLDHDTYIGYDEMAAWLEGLDRQFEHVTVDRIGVTEGNRDIKLVKINSNNTDLPIIFIDAGMHAREWISPAATMYIIERLAKVLKKKKDHKSGHFQWHILPLVNPDGYEYSRTNDRLWRKNTRNLPGTTCIGVDLNRNFPEGYGVGASTSKCSEVYQGPRPFSEVESITIRDYVSSILGQTRVAISVHSYGNVLIYPWGYKTVDHPNKAQLANMADTVVANIRNKANEVYEPGTAVEVFGSWGLAGGATDDYYISLGIPYSFTFELPERDDSGGHGFLLPPSNIVRVGKQLMIGVNTIADYLINKAS